MKAIEYHDHSYARQFPFHRPPPPPPFPVPPNFPFRLPHPQWRNSFQLPPPPIGVPPPGFENFLEVLQRLNEFNGGLEWRPQGSGRVVVNCDGPAIQCNGGLRWRPQGSGCVVVNCDGSFRPRDKSVGYGAIIRDQNGKVIRAMANYEKIISPEVLHGPAILLAELKAISGGIQLASRLGYKEFQVQSDSKDAINILKRKGLGCPKECSDVSREILAHKNFDKLKFYFVYRETNQAADFLSRFRTSVGEKIFSPSDLPPHLEKIVEDDNNEDITYTRSKNCRVNFNEFFCR